MFEFVLSIRVSSVLVGAGRMPRSCAATTINLESTSVSSRYDVIGWPWLC